MTLVKKLLFVSVCSLALSGCKPLKEAINNQFNAGKVEGVSQCIELSATDILSEETIRASCITKFEKVLTYSVANKVTGRGGPRSQNESEFFAGTMTNNTQDHVVTEVVVEVEFRGTGEEAVASSRATIEGWFEPNGNPVTFRSNPVEEAPELWGNSEYCDDEGDDSCWGWYIVSVKGLEL